jgi:hypothetical protein
MLLTSCEGELLIMQVITCGAVRLLTLVVVTVGRADSDHGDSDFEIQTSERRVVDSCNDDRTPSSSRDTV